MIGKVEQFKLPQMIFIIKIYLYVKSIKIIEIEHKSIKDNYI